jgi:hypothetical protein
MEEVLMTGRTLTRPLAFSRRLPCYSKQQRRVAANTDRQATYSYVHNLQILDPVARCHIVQYMGVHKSVINCPLLSSEATLEALG